MSPRAILYARVSTADKGQDWHAQIEELEKVADQRGWVVVGHYHDQASGAKTDRAGLAAAVERCRRGGVDVFAAVSSDRFARSVRDLLDLVDNLEACGLRVACTREGALDTTTPQGRAFMQVRAVFAELERRLTAQRIREALAIRKARGVKLGRRRTIDYKRLPSAKEMRMFSPPSSWSQIAKTLGGSPGAWSAAVRRAAP